MKNVHKRKQIETPATSRKWVLQRKSPFHQRNEPHTPKLNRQFPYVQVVPTIAQTQSNLSPRTITQNTTTKSKYKHNQ
jgi:hypothetical protein